VLVFLTNQTKLGATTIAAIYKDRWQIELLFKALKQDLKIRTFVGTSANAVKIQVWTALIALLLLRSLQLKARFAWSLSNLVALLHMNLFTHRGAVDVAASAVRDTTDRGRGLTRKRWPCNSDSSTGSMISQCHSTCPNPQEQQGSQ
jgi:hypothetical protein